MTANVIPFPKPPIADRVQGILRLLREPVRVDLPPVTSERTVDQLLRRLEDFQRWRAHALMGISCAIDMAIEAGNTDLAKALERLAMRAPR